MMNNVNLFNVITNEIADKPKCYVTPHNIWNCKQGNMSLNPQFRGLPICIASNQIDVLKEKLQLWITKRKGYARFEET